MGFDCPCTLPRRQHTARTKLPPLTFGNVAYGSMPVRTVSCRVVLLRTVSIWVIFHRRCNQRIGLASSPDPAGPWTRAATPIVNVGPAGAWDDLFTCNPTPLLLPNGSALLLYKARSKADPGKMSTGVAFAQHWSGPYVKNPAGAIDGIPGGCEDAGIYQSPETGVFRIVLHCGCAFLSLWSRDGVSWTLTPAAQAIPWCNVTWSDGSAGVLSTRQRPKWVRAKNGTVVALLTGAASNGMHGGDTFTMVQEVRL
jgi:hypothetical protein